MVSDEEEPLLVVSDDELLVDGPGQGTSPGVPLSPAPRYVCLLGCFIKAGGGGGLLVGGGLLLLVAWPAVLRS